MLKEQAAFIRKISILADMSVLLSAMGIAWYVHGLDGAGEPFRSYLMILGFAFPLWHYLLYRQGLFASVRRHSAWDLILALGKVHILGGVVLAAIIFLIDPLVLSREVFLVFLVSAFVLMSLERVVVRLGLGHIRRLGYNFRNILVVGTSDKAQALCGLIEKHADWGLRIVGFVQVNPGHPADRLNKVETLGELKDLIDICKANPVDEVIFCLPNSSSSEAERYIEGLEELGVTVRVALDLFGANRAKKELSLFHGEIPLLTLRSTALDVQQNFSKRTLDVIGSLVGLAITAVLSPFIAIAIKLDSPGPVLFGQARIGLSGRIFKCWKFRSMHIDAEERKKDLLARNEMQGAIFKIRNDPRITRVGRFLRQTSLDELPQFWNVLKGDMSLVGTRPPTPDEVADYQNWHRRRICIKPGITGLWQVSGRNQVEKFDDIVRLDLKYIDNWTTRLDVQILLKTIWVVFSRRGSS